MYNIILGRDKSDKEKFGDKGLIYLGKGYVKMGQHTSMSNNLFMDVVRSHVVLVAGKRGCLTEDTLIFTDKGYKRIVDFKEQQDKILSFNKEKKEFEWENAKLLEYDINNEKLLEVELCDGRRINITKEHPLLVNYGKYIFWRSGIDLKEKDKLVLPLNMPEVTLNKESVRMARILGFILADGSIARRKGRFKDGRGKWYNGTKTRLRFYNQCPEVLEKIKKDLEEEFNITAKRYERKDCNCEVIETKHQKVIDKLEKLGVPIGLKSGIIRVPKVVFQSSNTFKREFVSALFDCDGYIDKNGKVIDYSSKSRKFLDDLQLILTDLGIESVIRNKNALLNKKKYENYRLFITDNTSVERFKKIGFSNPEKIKRLEKHKSNNTRRRKTHYISENLACTRIKSIKPLEGIKKVYDLSVNKNHSFIANGIISHNSGKSYTLGVMTEELSSLDPETSKNIASLIFDTMGIFWTMKYPNEKEKHLLEEWNLKPKNLPIRVFAPYGKLAEYQKKNIPIDYPFALKTSELEAEDWIITFNLSMTSQEGVLIQKIITELKETEKNYTLSDIIKKIDSSIKVSQETKNIVSALFEASKTWGIFAEEKDSGTEVTDLVNAGETSILDLSVYSSIGAFNVRALVIGLISRKLFKQRIEARKSEEIQAIRHGVDYLSYNSRREMPLIWLFVDEAHEFLPRDSKTPATEALVQLLREGRQPGISVVLATQQPGQIHKDVMTQSDIVLSHRVTSKPDVEALNEIMQTYLLDNIKKKMDELPSLKGSAIILDDNSERIYSMRMRPRFTWHGGEAPTAVKAEKKF